MFVFFFVFIFSSIACVKLKGVMALRTDILIICSASLKSINNVNSLSIKLRIKSSNNIVLLRTDCGQECMTNDILIKWNSE